MNDMVMLPYQLLTPEPALSPWTPDLLLLQPAEQLCEDYMGHCAGAEEWHGHSIPSLQCK